MGKNSSSETFEMGEAVAGIDSIAELKKYINETVQVTQSNWAHYFTSVILPATGLNQAKLAEKMSVSRAAVSKWVNGAVPKDRERFIKLGLLARFDESGINRLLQRYGRFSALYAKTLEDCVCLYVLRHPTVESNFDRFNNILERIRGKAIMSHITGSDMSTVLLDQQITQTSNDAELEQFIEENAVVFAMAYHRFRATIKASLLSNAAGCENIYQLAEQQQWSASLRQIVSFINQDKWIPTRNKIISLGLHLLMDREQIDEMLEMVYMEPLCAKNVFECVIIYILEDAKLNEYMDLQSDATADDPDRLIHYARRVIEEIDFPEVQPFISELAEEI